MCYFEHSGQENGVAAFFRYSAFKALVNHTAQFLRLQESVITPDE